MTWSLIRSGLNVTPNASHRHIARATIACRFVSETPPRKENANLTGNMAYTRAQRKRVFLSWKAVFSFNSQNSHLRKQKAITAVVRRHRPGALPDAELIGILQSLLNQGIFQYKYEAARTFPELFESRPISTETTRAKTICPPPQFGMDGPSKELMGSFESSSYSSSVTFTQR